MPLARRAGGAVNRLAQSLVRSDPAFPAMFLLCLLWLGIHMLPDGWSGNEIHYFDLGYRNVRPDAFTEHHAAFDGLKFRSLALYGIGWLVDAIGYEAAHVVLAYGQWLAMSAAVAFAMCGLRMPLAAVAAGLFVFFDNGQELMGGEWIFGTVEGKVPAYVLVFLGLGLAARERPFSAVASAAGATYLHFLVGGFWGLAVCGLIALLQGWRGAVRPAALFAMLIVPLMALLVAGRFGGTPPDLSGIDLTVNQIYSAFRHPHHVAPYVSAEWFRARWLPGLLATMAISAGLGLALFCPRWPNRAVTVWLLILNLYLVAAFGLAWLDRHSHALGQLYLFRPASLVLLLSGTVLAAGLLSLPSDGLRRAAGFLIVAAALVLVVPSFGAAVYRAAMAPTLAGMLTDPERELVSWLREHARPEQPVLILGWEGSRIAPLALERLSGRPMLVDYKFVPTEPHDIVRWYRLLQWRNLVRHKGCEALHGSPAAFVITTEPANPNLADCTEPVWSRAGLVVLRVRN